MHIVIIPNLRTYMSTQSTENLRESETESVQRSERMRLRHRGKSGYTKEHRKMRVADEEQ